MAFSSVSQSAHRRSPRIGIDYLCGDVLKALDHLEDLQRQTSDTDVMSIPVIAAPY